MSAQDTPARRATAALNVAYAARLRGDTAQARVYFQRALDADTSQVNARIELGYLALEAGNKATAVEFLRGAVERDRTRADIRRQLAFSLIDLRRQAEAIAAFESIADIPGGLSDRDQLALAYLYDATARNTDAMRAFTLATTSTDTSIANPARRALIVKGDVGTVLFSEGYLAPFYQTRFENSIGIGLTRLGVESGTSWAPAAYLSLRVTRDTKSSGGLQSRVFSDNAAVLAGGLRVRPFHGPLWLYAEAGSARALLSDPAKAWTSDVRAGAYMFAVDERRLYRNARWKLMTDVGGDVSWYQRFDRNTIGYLQVREGARFADARGRGVDIFARGWAGFDSRGEFYNSAVEGGGGLAIHPATGVVLFVEGIQGRYRRVPPVGTPRTYTDWRFTAVFGWRALKVLRPTLPPG